MHRALGHQKSPWRNLGIVLSEATRKTDYLRMDFEEKLSIALIRYMKKKDLQIKLAVEAKYTSM